MPAATSEKDVLALERSFWDALQAKDARQAERMTAERCIVVGAQGVSAIDGPTMAQLTREGRWEIEKYAFDEKNAQVHFIDDDVAIVAYSVSERVVIDGETLPLEANDSSVWVRRNGEWRCALHTESLAGDPYGRDRTD